MVKGQIFDSMFTFNTPSFAEINDVVCLVEQACDAVVLERSTSEEHTMLKCVEQLVKVIT